ncbi:histidine kinase [Rubritalea sp.]|uniref:histidine kinase n=1 Tax=Rubritalea sp. TaxID=2109375 RepID=UPI003EF08F5D
MFRRSIIYLLFLLASLFQTVIATPKASSSEPSVSELEQCLESIDAEIKQLASYSLRSGSGTVGYQSLAHKTPHHNERIRIDLGAEYPIDQVVLVPTIRRDPNTGLQADGFPLAFRILAGTAGSSTVVASFTEQDNLLPRIAPLVISIPPIGATWIALEASCLSTRGWDQFYVLQLSEIMVFSGFENVALNKPVTAKSRTRNQNARAPQFLVDGFVPYLMDSSINTKSKPVTFHTNDQTQNLFLTIDLEKTQQISQINLHMTDLNHTIPEATLSDHAVPRRIRAIASNQPDFKEQTVLFESRQNSIYDIGPILMRCFPEIACRYVQIQILEFQPNIHNPGHDFSAGFAEIEILSKGQNVALNKPITDPDKLKQPKRLKRLTDGSNYLGEILTSRDWMTQLAKRHDLQTERPLIAARLNELYTLQKNKLRRMYWIAILLAFSIALTIILVRIIHRKKLDNMRTRFAADLHDELGANLHAIGLLGDLAKEAVHSPDDLIDTVNEIRALTERTGKAARYCADIYEAQLCDNLKIDMQRTAQRILADIEYDLTIEGDVLLQQLKPRTRADLFLFYKESLVNVSRHSDANHCTIRCVATEKEVLLSICDNGIGMHGTAKDRIPNSLQRRARLLKAKISLESPSQGGTKITLLLYRKLSLAKLKNR